MRLVFFRDAIEHVTRIVRMITTERGNALLVGVGGTGKQSLTRLAAHMCGYNCFQIELTRGYGYEAFHEDLRKVCYFFSLSKLYFDFFQFFFWKKSTSLIVASTKKLEKITTPNSPHSIPALSDDES